MLISKKTVLIFFTAIILLAGILTVAQPAMAAPWQLVPKCGTGGCNVCDAIGVGINVTKIMLGTLGSAALLMFVYGGVLMAISRGHSDQVQKGKDALINATKGVIIVLGSWLVINYGLAMMLTDSGEKEKIDFRAVKVNDQSWFKIKCDSGAVNSISAECKDKVAGTECKTENGLITMRCNKKQQCEDACDKNKLLGYSCQDPAGKTDCMPGLCHGTPDNYQCCK